MSTWRTESLGKRHGDALHRGQRRQLGECGIGPEPARLRLYVGLLTAQVIVALRRDRTAVGGVADDTRLDEHEQIRLGSRSRVVAKCLSQDGKIAGKRNLVGRVSELILDQAAEYDDLLIVDNHR